MFARERVRAFFLAAARGLALNAPCQSPRGLAGFVLRSQLVNGSHEPRARPSSSACRFSIQWIIFDHQLDGGLRAQRRSCHCVASFAAGLRSSTDCSTRVVYLSVRSTAIVKGCACTRGLYPHLCQHTTSLWLAFGLSVESCEGNCSWHTWSYALRSRRPLY